MFCRRLLVSPTMLPLLKLSDAALRVLLFIGLLAVVPAASAQFDTAAVTGTVTDGGGATVPNAIVSLRNVDLGTTLTRKSDAHGNYDFPDVQIGTYTVSASAAGFAETITKPFELKVSARQQIDVPLKIGAATESVTVSIDAAGLQKESGDRSTTIESEQMIDLPLNGREYSDLALLVPGVQISTLQNGEVDQRRSSIVVNGNRSSVNNFLLDGLDNNSYQEANQGFNNQAVSESADAVQQYTIITSNFPADYGRSGGAIINVKTKSGSNALHGSVFEYARNTAFNAYGPFYGTGVKPTLVKNQFGFSLGYHFPKIKDFFFFVDYEGFRQVSGNLVTETIPTMDQRNGIFVAPTSATDPTLIPVPLQNPLTGKKYVNGIIPTSDYTPFAAAVLAALPNPTQTIIPGSGTNFQQLEQGINNRDIGDIRLDKYFGNRLQTFVRVSKQSNHITDPPGITGPAGGGGFGHIRVLTNAGVAGATFALNSNSVLDLRMGITYANTGKIPYYQGTPNFYSRFNIPYPVSPELPPSGLNQQQVNYFSNFGAGANNNQFDSPSTYNVKGTYTLAKGRHSISLGYEWLHVAVNLDPGYPLLGIDTYLGGFSYLNANPRPASGVARKQAIGLADFIFGARDSYSLANYTSPHSFYDYRYAYVEDSWRAFPLLTLTYGLRYEFVTPERSNDQQLANFNPKTNQLILATSGSLYNQALVNPKLDNFAPRFGFAYSLYPNIVFRGGYGISFVQFNRTGGGDDLLFNGPATVEGKITQQPSKTATAVAAPLPLCADGSLALNTCFRTTMQGYPASLISPADFSTATTETRYVPTDVVPGYIQSYSVGTQIQMDKGTILNIAYVGSHGVHVRVQADYNETAPQAPNQILTLTQRRPIQNFETIYDNFGGGFLRYNSLQTNLTHRFTGGLFLMNSFTWARAFDSASGSTDAAHGDSQYVSLRQPSYYGGISGYDQRLNDSFSAVWKIPYGTHFGNRALRQIAGGWTLTTITRLTTGIPYNINYSPDDADETSDLLTYRPNYTGSIQTILNPRSKWIVNNTANPITYTINGKQQSCTGYCNVFNTSQLSAPTLAADGGTSPYGNLPRNAVTGPRYINLDFGLQKNFPLPRRTNLQFRAEAFNIMNHTNFKAPNVGFGSSSFGEFTGGSGSVFPSRQMQLAARFTY